MLVLLFLLFTLPMLIAGSTNMKTNIQITNNGEIESLESTIKPTGGTLRVGWNHTARPIEHLNPLLKNERGVTCYPIFNSLIRLDENGIITSDLAKSWKREGSDYTFYLYDNVTWHDGNKFKFTASDVEFTFDTILNNNDTIIDWYWKEATSKLVSVEIPDSTTVVFHLNEPYAPFLYFGGSVPIIPEHVYKGNLYNETVVGTGPFKFVSWTPRINMTLSANTEYFRGRPYIDNIFYRWDIPLAKLADYLMNNTIDLVPENIDPNRIAEIQKVPGISISNADELAYFALGCNLRNPILNNSDFRKALAYAIDKTKLIEVYLGYAKESTGPLPPALSYWYNPNVTKYQCNVTEAKRLLKESGYANESITLKVKNTDPLRINVSEIIVNQLNNAGVNVTLITENSTTWESDIFKDFNFNLTLIGWTLGADPDTIYSLYHSAEYNNPWNYNNTDLDKLLEQGRTEYDDTQRKVIYDKVQEILAEDIPTIFLYHRIRINDHNNDFHDLICTPSTLSIDAYSLEKVYYEKTLSGQGKSPIKVCFVDKEGRRTGFFNGSIVNEIPNATYDEEFNVVKIRSPPETKITIRNPDNPYMRTETIEPSYFVVEVTGTGFGHYRLELVNIALDYKSVIVLEDDTEPNKTDRYWIVIYTNGLIYQSFYPPPLQITYTLGKQLIIPADGVDPESYDRKHGNTIIPR